MNGRLRKQPQREIFANPATAQEQGHPPLPPEGENPEPQRASDPSTIEEGQSPVPAAEEAQPIKGLSPLQSRAIALLASGMRISAVAEELVVDRTTIYRWKREPAFAVELARLTEDMRGHLEAGVVALGDDALVIVAEVMAAWYDNRARLAAAALVLKHALAPKEPARG